MTRSSTDYLPKFVRDFSVGSSPFFDLRVKVSVARAPGRLDVMGGIADYSGSLVLQMPIKESTYAFAQLADDEAVSVASIGSHGLEENRYLNVSTDFVWDNLHQPDAFWRKYFEEEGSQWAAYILGCLIVLLRKQDRPRTGCRILIVSEVPEGKGVSSSAALEIATMMAVSNALGIDIDKKSMAMLSRQVENSIAGAPCGIMDQMAVALGRERHLMALLCQPAELQEFVAVPDELAIWGIDSGIRHSVAGSDYNDVRVAAFMGLQILNERSHTAEIQYLANVSPDMFNMNMSVLPEAMPGAEFTDRYGSLVDSVSRLDPDKSYAVRVAARHPVYEHARINEWNSILKSGANGQLARLGELMYESHGSYSACGLGSDGTDLLVSLVKEHESNGLLGARISGGGSGGTVVVLGEAKADAAIETVCNKYEEQTGYRPYVFAGSSAGAEVLV